MANFTEINGIFLDSPIKFKNTEHRSPYLDALTVLFDGVQSGVNLKRIEQTQMAPNLRNE